jgi:hypothetical protein
MLMVLYEAAVSAALTSVFRAEVWTSCACCQQSVDVNYMVLKGGSHAMCGPQQRGIPDPLVLLNDQSMSDLTCGCAGGAGLL